MQSSAWYSYLAKCSRREVVTGVLTVLHNHITGRDLHTHNARVETGCLRRVQEIDSEGGEARPETKWLGPLRLVLEHADVVDGGVNHLKELIVIIIGVVIVKGFDCNVLLLLLFLVLLLRMNKRRITRLVEDKGGVV